MFFYDERPLPGEEYGCRCWAEPYFSEDEGNEGLTKHGIFRSGQRQISIKEALEAINSAGKTGSITQKIGKYGTKQFRYKGSNGITLAVELEGRQAGKIITFWRNVK